MGWLGAVAGGAGAANNVIDNRLKSITDEETRQGVLKKETDLARIQDQISSEKEKRVQEAEIAREGRTEQSNVRKEERAHDNAIRTRNENHEFITDPNRAIEASKAKVAGQQIEDEYKNSQFPIELEQKKQIAKATDNTDYEQQRLNHEKTRIEIDEALTKGTDLSEREKKALEIYAKDYQNTYETINKRIEGGTLDPNSEEYVTANVELYNKKQSIDALLGIETKSIEPGKDYAGIRTEEEKQQPKPEEKKTGLLDAFDTIKEDYKGKPASTEDRESAIRAKIKADIKKREDGSPLKQIWNELNRKPTSGGNQYQSQGGFESDDALYNRILKEELSN
jgi:hypothetical protein